MGIDAESAQFTDEHLKEYSKKILGFAYDKTGNIFDAEDLSQEILIALFTSIPKYAKIENMDGFVYTICHHCWSNFLRKNKKHWRHANVDDMYNLGDGRDVQSEVETAVFLEKMRAEIAYLSKLHRDIIIMAYYDGKSSRQISKELDISDSTVRWHLAETRKKLKGRIENMSNENLNYRPIALNVGHNGSVNGTNGMKGLGQNRIVDNICYVCYGIPLTIEEIARKLSVAAVFLEYHIDELVYMDYLKIVDEKKYQTNFFIKTPAYGEIAAQHYYDNIKDLAGKFYEAIEKRYDDIKAINFLGSDLDKDFILWILIPKLIRRLESEAACITEKKNNWSYYYPKRKDGSEHWVCASLQDCDYTSTISQEAREFSKKTNGNGIKIRGTDNNIRSLQLDSYATLQLKIYWRDFNGDELKELSRIAEIIRNNLTPNDYDKILIAKHAGLGYIKVDGGKPQMMIPYLNKDEYEKLDKIFSEIESELGNDFFVDFNESYTKKAKSQIPDFISEDEKVNTIGGITCAYAIPYYLSEHNKLRYPTDEEAKRLCTIVWEGK